MDEADYMFNLWFNLYNEFKDLDMNDPKVRKEFNNKFTTISKKYWMLNLQGATPKALDRITECLSEIWCNHNTNIPTVVEAYKNAIEYLDYASDRMTYNRWLYLRMLLNLDIQ